MRLTDQEVIDTLNAVLARRNVHPSDRLRYLRIVDPPQFCQVEHDHWEGKMSCGNPMPCSKHGGR